MYSPGHYVYFEAAGSEEGKRGVLAGPVLDWGTKVNCLSFWYMMFGKDVGTLRVLTASPADIDANRTVLWTSSTKTDQTWHHLELEFDASKSTRVSVYIIAFVRFDSLLTNIYHKQFLHHIFYILKLRFNWKFALSSDTRMRHINNQYSIPSHRAPVLGSTHTLAKLN